jgi:cell wall-associated NlpC family hydrolase
MSFKHLRQSFLTFIVVFIYGCASYTPTTTANDAESAKQEDRNLDYNYNGATTGKQIVATAKSLLGTPYLLGGSTPQGFDCSGLVYYSYQSLGMQVPRTTKQLANQATVLKKNEILPGDLLFFQTSGRKISHVGIYAGESQFIHAPKSGKSVSYANIEEPYWRKRLVKAGRLH